MRRIEDALAARAEDREQIRAEIASVKSRVKALEDRIHGLEAGL